MCSSSVAMPISICVTSYAKRPSVTHNRHRLCPRARCRTSGLRTFPDVWGTCNQGDDKTNNRLEISATTRRSRGRARRVTCIHPSDRGLARMAAGICSNHHHSRSFPCTSLREEDTCWRNVTHKTYLRNGTQKWQNKGGDAHHMPLMTRKPPQ